MPFAERRSVFFFLCLFLGHFAQAAELLSIGTGKNQSVLISADRMNRDLVRHVLELEGRVQLTFEGQHIRADRAMMNLTTRDVEAEGNVIISSPATYAEGEKVVLHLKDGTGLIYNGFIKSGQVLFEGEVIERLSEKEYIATRGRYTSCTKCPPVWRFAGRRVRAELGGYAWIKYPIFSAAGFPVLWLPYLVVPLKSERQTGLLVPSVEISQSDGVALSIPFFWAISRSQDATFTMKNYTRRGIKLMGQYRYLLNESASGQLDFATIRDQRFADDSGLPQRPASQRSDRWFTSYSQSMALPQGFMQRTNLTLVSDLRYARDFPNEVGGFGDPAIENRLSLAKNTEQMHGSAEISYFINQLKSNPLDDNRDAVHRFPELRFRVADSPLASTGFIGRMDINYVNFARDDFSYDNVENVNGVLQVVPRSSPLYPDSSRFNPDRDIVRTGQRVTFNPEIHRTFQMARLFTGEVGAELNHTQYNFNVRPPPNVEYNTAPARSFLRTRASFFLPFSKVYSLDARNDLTVKTSDPGVFSPFAPTIRDDRLLHEIRPEVLYTGVPWLMQPEHPFFGQAGRLPSFLSYQPLQNSDFRQNRGIQFDYLDRVTDRDLVTFQVTQRFTRKKVSGASSEYKEVALVRLSQGYDLSEDRRVAPKKFYWTDTHLLADLKFDRVQSYTDLRYYPYHGALALGTSVRIADARKNAISVSYFRQPRITETIKESELIDNDTSRPEGFGFGAELNLPYVYLTGGTSYRILNYSPFTAGMLEWSAGVNFRPPGDCWRIILSINRRIGDEDNRYAFAFDFDFGGEGKIRSDST